MFGWNQNPARSSLAEWMVTTLQKGEEVPGFEDVYFSPLFTAHLTGYLLQAMEKDLQGVYNVGSAGGLSKFEFGRLLAQGMGLNPDLVRPVSQSQAKLTAPRPASPVMDSSRFYQALGTRAPEVKEEITSFWEWRRGNKLREFRRFGGYA
jgi:dTDP-4-dehydrorhamnose reductase